MRLRGERKAHNEHAKLQNIFRINKSGRREFRRAPEFKFFYRSGSRYSGIFRHDSTVKLVTGSSLNRACLALESCEREDRTQKLRNVYGPICLQSRYRGRVFIRVGPRRDIATEAEERILAERRCSFMATFDATPCLNARLEDLDIDYIKTKYFPMAFDAETFATDRRDIKEQLASVHLYDRDNVMHEERSRAMLVRGFCLFAG